MAKSKYICDQCGKEHEAYPSTKKGKNCFCSHGCRSEFQKTSLIGVNNPNYRGVDIGNSYCECGIEKDYRAKECSQCAGRSTPVGKPKKIEISEQFIKAVLDSVTFQEVSAKVAINRHAVSRIIRENNIDISHFSRNRARCYYCC